MLVVFVNPFIKRFIMNTIIVPTDFSPVSTNALNYAIEMAKVVRASVLIFHAYQVPISYSDTPILLVSVEEMRKSAEGQLDKLKADIEHVASGLVKIYSESQMGDTVDELENLCHKINPLAVVMGSHGATGIESILFGSTTLSAIRHLTCPVISIPPGKSFGAGIKRIGFACDFKEVVATTPAPAINNFVTMLKAELHVLNVDHPATHSSSDIIEESALLQTMLAPSKPVYHFIDHTDIEDGINEFAERNNLDLLIVIPKKHKKIEALFSKSHSKKLVQQSRIPVLCLHE
jgi:nucleotide-binding universal stress UspA family protein